MTSVVLYIDGKEYEAEAELDLAFEQPPAGSEVLGGPQWEMTIDGILMGDFPICWFQTAEDKA